MTSIEETKAAARETAAVEPKPGARRARKTKAEVDSKAEAQAATPKARRGRKPKSAEGVATTTAAPEPVAAAPRRSKLDRLAALLTRPEGASLTEMMAATGWQAHSVRGAMAGSLRKRGLVLGSAKDEDGVRRYRIEAGS